MCYLCTQATDPLVLRDTPPDFPCALFPRVCLVRPDFPCAPTCCVPALCACFCMPPFWSHFPMKNCSAVVNSSDVVAFFHLVTFLLLLLGGSREHGASLVTSPRHAFQRLRRTTATAAAKYFQATAFSIQRRLEERSDQESNPRLVDSERTLYHYAKPAVVRGCQPHVATLEDRRRRNDVRR